MADEQTSSEDQVENKPNPYQTLGVSSDASPKDIQRAYRTKARKFHPDLAPGPAAEAFMKELNIAYAVLSDPVKRKAYDTGGWSGIPKYEGPIASEKDKEDLKVNMEEAIKLAEDISKRNDMLNKFDPMTRLEFQTHNPAFGIYHENMAGMWDRNSYSQYREYSKTREKEAQTKKKAETGSVPICNCASPIINYSKSGPQTCKRCGKLRNWSTRPASPPQIGPVY